MARKHQEVCPGDIVVDHTYQVRKEINHMRVASYAECMGQGDVFPPVVVEEGTNKLVCGFTRVRAYKQVFKDQPRQMIPATMVSFPNEIERIKFAASDNRNHGEPLQPFDKRNIIKILVEKIVEAEGLSVDDEARLHEINREISRLIGLSVGKVEEISGFIIIETPGRKRGNGGSPTTPTGKTRKAAPRSEPIEIPRVERVDPNVPSVMVDGKQELIMKANLQHLHSKEISRAVFEKIQRNYGGMPDHYYVGEVIMRLEDGTMNLENQATVKKLRRLMCLIGEAVRGL